MNQDNLQNIIKQVNKSEKRRAKLGKKVKKLRDINIELLSKNIMLRTGAVKSTLKLKIKIKHLMFNLWFLMSIIFEYYKDELYDIYYAWRYKCAIKRWAKLAGLDKLPEEKIIRPKPWDPIGTGYKWIIKEDIEQEQIQPKLKKKWWHFNPKTKPEDLQSGFYYGTETTDEKEDTRYPFRSDLPLHANLTEEEWPDPKNDDLKNTMSHLAKALRELDKEEK